MTPKQFVHRVQTDVFDLRKETKEKLAKIIEFRLKGHSLEEIAEYFDLSKSRIFKLERDFISKALTSFEWNEYDDLVSEAKKKLTSIKRG